VPVHRQEVYEEIQRSNQEALTRQSTPLPKLAGVAAKKPAAARRPDAESARPENPSPA
jgi:hypothetical protein